MVLLTSIKHNIGNAAYVGLNIIYRYADGSNVKALVRYIEGSKRNNGSSPASDSGVLLWALAGLSVAKRPRPENGTQSLAAA